MRINLNRIRWMNLLSYGNAFTELDFTETKTTLLIGKNGGGKSTMIDALNFALFNKPYRPVKRQELVNTITGKDTMIEIEFDTPQHQYLVRRGIAPSVFEIYRDGDLVQPPADAREYQAHLEQVLGMAQKTFEQIVMLGSTNYVPFMRLKPADRRAVVEDLLDVQVFSVMGSLLKSEVDANKAAMAQAEEDLRHALKMLEVVSTHRDSALADIEQMIEEKIALMKQAEAEIEQMGALAAEKNQEAANLKELKETVKNISAEISTATSDNDALKWQLQGLTKELKFLEEHQDCPTCGQKIDLQYREYKENTLTTDILALKKQVEEGLSKISELRERLHGANEAVLVAQKASDAVKNLVARAKERKRYIDALEQDITSLRQKLNETSGAETGEVMKVENEITAIRTRQGELREHQEVIRAAQSLLKDGGVRAKVVRQYIPILNRLINKYLAALDFFVDFNLDEEFNETIRSRFRDTLSYDAFSEGEKLRINLAILFAWRALARLRSSAHVNVLVMDEILDGSLDAAGADEFIKVLLELPKDEHIFVISHRGDQLTDKFDRTLIFHKEQNFSQMLEYQ